jgi:hypothetical protein
MGLSLDDRHVVLPRCGKISGWERLAYFCGTWTRTLE